MNQLMNVVLTIDDKVHTASHKSLDCDILITIQHFNQMYYYDGCTTRNQSDILLTPATKDTGGQTYTSYQGENQTITK